MRDSDQQPPEPNEAVVFSPDPEDLSFREHPSEKVDQPPRSASGEIETNQVIVTTEESTSKVLGYMLIGMALSASERVQSGLDALGRATLAMSRLADPILEKTSQSPWFRPARNRFNRLVQRGEQVVNGWVETGRRETVNNRRLIETAVKNTIDRNIEYLAQNPEIKELVAAQSTGLANEVVEEVRERTVSADTLVEGVVRALLRRTPRHELPGPPDEVREQAVGFRELQKRRKREIRGK